MSCRISPRQGIVPHVGVEVERLGIVRRRFVVSVVRLACFGQDEQRSPVALCSPFLNCIRLLVQVLSGDGVLERG